MGPEQCGISTVAVTSRALARNATRKGLDLINQVPIMPLGKPAGHVLVLFGFKTAGCVEHMCPRRKAGDRVRNNLPLQSHEILEHRGRESYSGFGAPRQDASVWTRHVEYKQVDFSEHCASFIRFDDIDSFVIRGKLFQRIKSDLIEIGGNDSRFRMYGSQLASLGAAGSAVV